GLVWWWVRQGRNVSNASMIRAATAVGVGLIAIIVVGVVRSLGAPGAVPVPPLPPAGDWRAIAAGLASIGTCMFAARSADALSRASAEFPQPRIFHLRRATRALDAYLALVVGAGALAFFWRVPAPDRAAASTVPLAALVLSADTPGWLAVPALAAIAAG